jgi:hypothetical protein
MSTARSHAAAGYRVPSSGQTMRSPSRLSTARRLHAAKGYSHCAAIASAWRLRENRKTAARRSLRNPIRDIDSQCPLLSNNGQNVAVPRMSALCQKRTHAPQQNVSLFDHLAAVGEQATIMKRGRQLRRPRCNKLSIGFQLTSRACHFDGVNILDLIRLELEMRAACPSLRRR